MELARPKTKKKSRTRTDTHRVEDAESPATLSDIDVDIEFPTTAAAALDSLPSQDCSVAAVHQLQQLQLSEAPEAEEAVAAPVQLESAPDFDDLVEEQQLLPQQSASAPLQAAPLAERVSYPSLQDMQRELDALPDARTLQLQPQTTAAIETAILKPFSSEQLRELYSNPHLELVDNFEREFVQQELGADYKADALFELLTKYARCRQTLRGNRLDVEAVQKSVGQLAPQLWRRERRTVQYQGTCADSVVVRGSEQYEFAAVDEAIFDKVSSHLAELLNLVSFNCALNLYLAETHKLQITQIVQQLSPPQQPIPAPTTTTTTTDTAPLRTAISIFFHFLRRSPPDKQFADDLRTWLRHLVAHQLSTGVDRPAVHLFLMHHVLRCPAGIADWAAAFMQLPPPPSQPSSVTGGGPFAAFELHQCVAYLRAILRPVVGRSEFLRQHLRARLTSETPLDPVGEDLWILVDSDGDDEGSGAGESAAGERSGVGEVLKEKDLIALLNQMPLQQMFASITLATPTGSGGGGYHIDTLAIQATHLLRLLAFASDLVQLLGDGLRTYNTERYRQFAKMLGRLIRHTVLYVAESYALFGRAGSAGLSAATRDRIGVEFDAFVMRAAHFIYGSRRLGAWQYLALLPFAELRATTVWRLYCFLATGGAAAEETDGVEGEDCRVRVQSAEFLQRFNDSVVDVPAEDMYYLLQTFAAIAQSRAANAADRPMIECIVLQLFEIGFVNTTTSATSYKIVRDLLANITDETPDLLSALLERIKLRFRSLDNTSSSSGSSTGAAVYLCKSLPLARWQPTEPDFECIATWLLNSACDSPESALARTLLSRLNWGFAEDGEQLFLPADVHVRVACLLCEVAARHVPETVGRSGITESVRQVSNLVKNGGAASAQQQFAGWCWNMVTVLRLHGMDRGREERARLLQMPATVLGRVPELERLAAVFQGVADGQPLALYVAVLGTQCGHSVPLVCQRGFAQMGQLLVDYRQSAVVRCLELVTPLFVECSESLSKCAGFQSILAQLLSADKTYVKMAKDLIANDYPGPVVELLGQMLQAQCINHVSYAFATPLPLIMLWLECLTTPAPGATAWQRDPNAVYLVDRVLRVAWQTPAMWSLAKEFFRFMCTKKGDAGGAAGDGRPLLTRTSSSFLPAFLGTGPPAGATLASLPAISPNTLWMSLITLELEHEMLEVQSAVWPELLRTLRSVPAKATLDSVLKTAAHAVHCSQPPSASSLVLYRLANLMLATAVDHPLLPILGQRFFQLYLARVPMVADEARFASAFGVADKFYEHNAALMKRVKKFFALAEAELKAVALRSEDEAVAGFNASVSRLFGTFGLWLEETRLNQLSGQPGQQQAEFPPQYAMARLARLFAGDDSYWCDYVNFPAMRDIQRVEANKWQQTCYRTQPAGPSGRRQLAKRIRPEPHEIIAQQLATYDAPLAPPLPTCSAAVIPPIRDAQRLLAELRADFAKLNATALEFHTTVQELNFTDCNYKDLVRVLYSNRSQRCTRSLQCSSLLGSSSCRGGRDVTITITEPIIDGRIQNKIERNREKHQLNVDRQLSAPPPEAVLVFVRIEHYVRHILHRYTQLQQATDHQQQQQQSQQHEELVAITGCGIAFFYEIVDGMSEFADAFPPAHELLGVVLAQLGALIRDNQSGEGVRLLQTALRRPHLLQMLADMFTPSATAPVYFLDMYQFVVSSHMQKCDPKVLFVLLSKFDVAKWLVTFMPKLVDIGQLLRIIVQGLESWNQPDAALIQGVLRRHLVHIFQYDFPEHYGEVLQTVLVGCSDQRLLPTVLAELMQSIYQLANCPVPPPIDALQALLSGDSNDAADEQQLTQLTDCITTFATIQQLFNFKAVQETLALLTQHFRNERLQHGLHGLYPKHRDYCAVLAVLLRSYGCALVVTAVHAYPGLLADKLLDWLWPSLCDTFAPWLVPYFPHAMQQQQQQQSPPSPQQQQQPANWIRQVLANNDVLLPWSELYTREAQHMLHAYVDCLAYLLDSLPGSDQLLGHLFHWYETHYAHICVPRHVHKPLAAALLRLPWHRFRPQPLHVSGCHRTLQQFLPECHALVGAVFVRVQWTAWLQQQLPQCDAALRPRMLAELLLVFVKLAFEPHVREQPQLVQRMLQEAADGFPWAQLNCDAVAQVFDALVLIAEPAIVLTTLNAEAQNEALDAAVLNILQLACSMQLTGLSSDRHLSPHTHAKRMLYVKTIVRLLRLCGSKNQQLLTTSEGVAAFRAAVSRLLQLLDVLSGTGIDAFRPVVCTQFGSFAPITDRQTIDLMIEIVGSMQLPGEFTSKIFVESLVQWQLKLDRPSPLIAATLDAIGTCKVFSNNVIALLEATLFNYFRLPETGASSAPASWSSVRQRLGPSLPPIEGTDLVQRHNLLTLHVFTVYKLRALGDLGEQMTLLQRLHLILENYKTCDETEPKLLALWALMIAFGVQRLRHSDNAKSLLLTLGRFLQSASAHADGWGDGMLGALGLRRDPISRRRRLATRCLACVVFSLFPDISNPSMPCKEYQLAIDDLDGQVHSKRYADVRSVGEQAMQLVLTQRNATAAIASGTAFEAQTTHNICQLLRLFYRDAAFLGTLEDVWLFQAERA